MSPFIAFPVAIVVLIVAMYFLGVFCHIWPGPRALFERESYVYDESEEAVEVNDEEAVEVNRPVTGMAFTLMMPIEQRDYVSELEWRRINLRAKCPHLYSDDWYDQSRRSFSRWLADQAEIAAHDFREQMELMGIAT